MLQLGNSVQNENDRSGALRCGGVRCITGWRRVTVKTVASFFSLNEPFFPLLQVWVCAKEKVRVSEREISGINRYFLKRPRRSLLNVVCFSKCLLFSFTFENCIQFANIIILEHCLHNKVKISLLIISKLHTLYLQFVLCSFCFVFVCFKMY